jgi:hypothetical protein
MRCWFLVGVLALADWAAWAAHVSRGWVAGLCWFVASCWVAPETVFTPYFEAGVRGVVRYERWHDAMVLDFWMNSFWSGFWLVWAFAFVGVISFFWLLLGVRAVGEWPEFVAAALACVVCPLLLLLWVL